MSKELNLTKEIAEQFLLFPDSVELEEFTAIEDTAAEILSRRKGPLRLCGLRELSESACRSLSKHQGRLTLILVERLSLNAAKLLINHKNLYFHACDQLLIQGMPSRPPGYFPDKEDFPIQVKLLGWLNSPFHSNVTPSKMELTPENAATLAKHFPTDQTMHLNGWFEKIDNCTLQKLVPYTGAIEIAADQLKENAYSVIPKLNASELSIDNSEFCYPEDFSENMANALLTFRNKLTIPDFLPLSDEIKTILKQHPSLSHWGSMEEPSIQVTCGTCGSTKSHRLAKNDHGEGYENVLNCIKHNSWQISPDHGYICPECSLFPEFVRLTPTNV
ncbi:hypothetical protein [Gimesia sp.]|uniref:hypothetical protein n=1 Tax=Gimesia sp. TaxID=2024833 RepID=UPI003A936F33